MKDIYFHALVLGQGAVGVVATSNDEFALLGGLGPAGQLVYPRATNAQHLLTPGVSLRHTAELYRAELPVTYSFAAAVSVLYVATYSTIPPRLHLDLRGTVTLPDAAPVYSYQVTGFSRNLGYTDTGRVVTGFSFDDGIGLRVNYTPDLESNDPQAMIGVHHDELPNHGWRPYGGQVFSSPPGGSN